MHTKAAIPDDLLTTPEACRLLRITRQTLYTWLQKGRIKPWMKVGGTSSLFIRTEVEKLKATKYVRHNDNPSGHQGRSTRKPMLSGAAR